MSNVYEKILKFNSGLIPEMLEVKYRLMSKNFYRFFRGTSHLYYANLLQHTQLPASPVTWICGDLHMENFGSYKGDNRLVYFDLNDFDESLLAPASWEIVRFVSCVFIAFETLNIEKKKAVNMAKLFLKKYSDTLAKGKPMYIESQTAEGIIKTFLYTVSKRGQKRLLKKRTVKVDGKIRLKLNDKHREIEKDLKRELKHHLTDWIKNNSASPHNFVVVDIAFRRAGLGSLGLNRYLALLKSTNVAEQYLVIDMKQSRVSSLSPYVKIKQPHWPTEADRIISIQQRMQNVAPALLSSSVFQGESYVMQELQPTKDMLNFELIKHDYRNIYQGINDMAVLTASAQLRSSGRQGSANADALIEFGNNKDWQDRILTAGLDLSHGVRLDYEQFCEFYRKEEPERKSEQVISLHAKTAS